MTSGHAVDPSEELARFVTDLSYEHLEDDLVRQAERCFVDTVGVTLAGADQPASTNAAAIVASDPQAGTGIFEVTEYGTVPETVFVSGTAGHALDFDDVSWGMDGHPSVTLVAPILAAASRSDLSGRDAIAAFVAGFETECYLAAAISPDHYERGWHATSTFGTFGSAAATASVLDLSKTETRHALNVAASMPAGLKRNFGSMTKPLHVGHAVRSGTTAALLAARGFTADATAIGGERGFFDLYSGEDGPHLERLPELGERWALREDGIHVKKYPSCYFTHTSIAMAIDVVEEHDVTPDEVEAIEARLSQGAVDALPHVDPQTGLEAKFSLPYTVARAVVHGDVDLRAFEESSLGDEAVERVRRTVTFSADDDVEYDDHTGTLRIETTDGGYERTLSDPPGTHDNPLTDAELREKFEMCARRSLDDERVDRLWNALDSLREQPSMPDIVASA